MPLPASHTLAVVGAGPIGLEAALLALDRGFDVHVFERGEIADHVRAWGHVRMFTPWRMNVGPASRAHLAAAGVAVPADDACPTGAELVERALEPLAALPELKGRVHERAHVVHVGRRGALKTDPPGDPARAGKPFRLLVRDAGGRENFIHAFAVLDASGTYGSPDRAGTGGIPARGELYLAPQMSHHVDDVLGLKRARHAGRRTLVIGGGTGAATVVADLVTLAEQAPGTAVVWATREEVGALLAAHVGDALAPRRALAERARALAGGAHPAVAHVGGVEVEGFEFNSATHRYRVQLAIGETLRVEEVDEIVVVTGYHADDALTRELHAGEPGFAVVGAKAHPGDESFLLETGWREVAGAVERLAREQQVSAT